MYMKKILLIIVVGMFIILYCYGFSFKDSYTNVLEKENMENYIYVGVMSSQEAELEFKRMEEALALSPIVIKVKAIGPFEYYAREGIQQVEVLEVMKGNLPYKGEKIYITSNKRKMIDTGQFFFVGTGFTNFMNEGKEYLIFVEGLADCRGVDDNVYRLYDDSINICPIFSYENVNNTIIREDETIYGCIPYTKVKNNEIFIDSKEALEEFLLVKKRIMLDYNN